MRCGWRGTRSTADTASATGASTSAVSTNSVEKPPLSLREVLRNIGIVVLENAVELPLQLRLLDVGDYRRSPAVEEENGRLR